MDTSFEIEINYKGEDRVFEAEYVSAGYSYKINVEVNGHIISFEPDEERNFRAVANTDVTGSTDNLDRRLIEEIAGQLIVLFKDV